MISNSDTDKIFSLLKWIEPRSSENIQTWTKERDVMSNFVYKVEKFGKIKMIFFQVENLSEANFKKIYKKRSELSHLDFTLKNKGDKWILIWEPKYVK
ncbi:hypothetical protein IF125_07445 [Empedobacter stercoris]|uniref:hypothetical protein n=1 Tax=Empedobacter stercoris TaxID=1628248 RepID=UPI001CE12DDD|nr:hypothetical protein [Empedobacter stercoris]MCA4782098.1 hypothetical protein [Empedobacter stercoris]